VACCLLSFAWRGMAFGNLVSLCLLGGLLVSRHLGLHDYALVLTCCALSEGVLRQGFFWIAAPPVYIAMLLPEPWGALGVASVLSVFVIPFFELHRVLAGREPAPLRTA